MGKMKQIEKKIKKIEKSEDKIQHDELKNLILVIAAVIFIFLIFTVITSLIDPKKSTSPTEVVEETIQYEEIIVGEILNRNENSYYVLVQNNENVYNDLYSAYLDMYISENDDYNYYVVDLENAFNQKYIADVTKVSGNDISEYKFSDTTLIKVDKNKMDEVYTSNDTILAALEKLIK